MYISYSTCIFYMYTVFEISTSLLLSSNTANYSIIKNLYLYPTYSPTLSLSLSTIFLFTISSPYLHFQSFTLIYVSFLLQSLFLFSNLSPRYITNPALIPSTISLSPLPNHCTSLYKSLLNVNNLPLPTSQTSFNYSYINII